MRNDKVSEFDEFNGYEEHDESIHDMEESGETDFVENTAANIFGSMCKYCNCN